MRRSIRPLLAALLSLALLSGCAKAHRITDLDTGDVYYTTDFEPEVADDIGRATFTDARTGARIRLDHYEAEQMRRRELRDALALDEQGPQG